jgi:RNA polymerase subunit RPABC4/transcription elongation factor Spt4
MQIPGFDDASGVFTGVLVYAGMIIAAFWLAMVIWAARDMRSRTRDGLAPLIVAVFVAVLTLPGLLIYLLLRPRETLSEAYERSLEEEALLQAIEQKAACPGCRQSVREEWQACPNCHTRLKKPCVRCGKMLDLTWDLCPYCASAQPVYAAEVSTGAADVYAEPARYDNGGRRSRAGRRAEALEYVENDDSGR